jgi:N4-gp56 family major capsid protein
MANPNTNVYGDISPRTAGYAAKRLLERGQYELVTERFGHFDPQPKKNSKTRKWRRYESLPRATAPLAEGVPPTGQKITYSDIEVTLEQYGDSVKLTDVIMDTHEDPVLNESMDLCGEQAAETIEILRINVLKAGTSVFYANGVTARTSVNSAPTRGDFRKIYRHFKRNKAKEISKIVKASALVATEPVGTSYYCMGHTDLDADLRSISGFIPVENYSDSSKALPGEVGKLENFRIVLTPLFEPWEAGGASGTTFLSGGAAVASSTACDVYPLIFVARDAYAIVPLQGEGAVTPMVLNPGKPSKSDPLGQIGYVSWKTYQAAAILNHNWITRLECAATATPS